MPPVSAWLYLAVALIAGRVANAAAVNASSDSACNGHAELCNRLYSNMTFLGAHDSPNVQAGSAAANQNYTVKTQLDNGVRMLQGQGHNSSGVIHLCHTSCTLLDKGPLEDYLKDVKSWLDDNPSEVITMLWVNSDDLPVSQWAAVYESAGLVSYSYVPPTTPMGLSDWPTLQTMISAGTRAVTFMDNSANTSSVAYILDEFTQMWETPYDETDTSFPCTVDRISSSASTANILYTVNHFLNTNLSVLGAEVTIPNRDALNTTNAMSGTGSLGLQAENCASQHGRYPNFMLVDYYDMPVTGDTLRVAAQLNGVTWNGTVGNGTSSSSATSSTSPGADPPRPLFSLCAAAALVMIGIVATS